MLHQVPMYFYSWFRFHHRSIHLYQSESESETDCDWETPASLTTATPTSTTDPDTDTSLGVVVAAAAAAVAVAAVAAGVDSSSSSSGMDMHMDMHMDLSPSKQKSAVHVQTTRLGGLSEEDHDISSTQDESDISSTFWFRVVDDKSKSKNKNKNMAATTTKTKTTTTTTTKTTTKHIEGKEEASCKEQEDVTVASDTDRILRVVPFCSLVLRMDYSTSHSSHTEENGGCGENHANDGVYAGEIFQNEKDKDDHNYITELLARQKNQQLFYGDLRQRIQQVKGKGSTNRNTNTHTNNMMALDDEAVSLPEDLELEDAEDDDEDEDDDSTDSSASASAFQVQEPNTDQPAKIETTSEKETLETAESHEDGDGEQGVLKEQKNVVQREPLFGSGHEPLFVSGTSPVIPPRAPIPKLISFDASGSGSCSQSWKDALDRYQTMEDTNTGTSLCSNDNDNDKMSSSEDDYEDDAREEIFILDPVDPLVYGSIDYPYLQKSSDRLYELLKHHLLHLGDDDDDNTNNKVHNDTAARDLIQAYPETCQVRYHPPACAGAVFPLSYFCATGHLLNIQAAYTAYPEAIGQEDPFVGTPLHYACYHNAGIQVVEYLVQKFPEAVRVTNYSHQTPVHMACMSDQISLPVVELLLEHYPTAAQLADQDGYTPFHLACLHGAKTELLQLLIQTSPSVIRMNTRALQKALHVTCLHAPITETIELLLKRDPACVRATDEFFQTPLHCAVQGKACEQILTLLVQAHPGALYLKNDFDETPYRMAERLEAPADVLALLKT